MGPANHQKSKKNSKKNEPVANQNKEIFTWTGEHGEAFDLLKTHLRSALVLGYPDFSWSFKLETDAFLQGQGVVLLQMDENDTSCVISYATRSLQPSEQLIWNYSLAKLELLALKWVVIEKLKDYLLGSTFTMYTNNNPLTYVKWSKLGLAQIWWLSQLALFNFDIKYRTGKSNQAADTLSQHPKTNSDNFIDNEKDEYETI